MEIKTHKDYAHRINRVFNYIDENLDKELTLETVANLAYFSPYHFHRVFKHITGEPLNQYLNRRRIEKAAAMLIHKKELSITEISLQNGFSSNSSFTRAFKKYYQLSPTNFVNEYPHKFSKIGQETKSVEKYICAIDNLKKWIQMNALIEIKEIPKLHIAYISCIGSKNIPNSFNKLISWAAPLGLMTPEAKLATIYHDSFKITDADKVRMKACILLNEPIEVDGEIGLTTIEPGRFIVGHFEIKLDEFEKSWTGLFVWMNENGYKKADREPFEIYHNNFNEHPKKLCIVDFYIPIEA